jgi:hypothetical protein
LLDLSFPPSGNSLRNLRAEFVEPSTHPRVVITMPPPRKTHLEALIEKAPVESKGFFFFTPQQLRQLGDSRPVSGATAGNAVTTTANGSAMSQPMSDQFKLIRETGDISGFRLRYGSRPNDLVPFVLTLTPQYVAQALGKTPPGHVPRDHEISSRQCR